MPSCGRIVKIPSHLDFAMSLSAAAAARKTKSAGKSVKTRKAKAVLERPPQPAGWLTTDENEIGAAALARPDRDCLGHGARRSASLLRHVPRRVDKRR